MKTNINTLIIFLAAVLGLSLSACSDSARSTMNLDVEARVESLTISGFDAEINHSERTISLGMPVDIDLAVLKVDNIVLSPGAECDMTAGSVFNGLVPRALRITAGDVECIYTLTVSHDKVELLSFVLDGKYSGTIDNAAGTVRCFVPEDVNITAMRMACTANEGTRFTPESGSVVDFSAPVKITAVNRTASKEYTVTVVRDEISQAPKAFVGNVASPEALNAEAAAAYRWMMGNVPNTRYVCISDVVSGAVKLDDFKMIWCHFDWLDWPGQLWESRDQFNRYWMRGGAILASRDGARYINDVWRIARDAKSPNNMFGGESYESLNADAGFTVTAPAHPLFKGIETDAQGRILLLGAGCSFSNRTLQWAIDWDPYFTLEGWHSKTGAVALASNHEGETNRVTIAEFEPYEAMKGYTSGRVIVIGTPTFEWHNRNATPNPYSKNMEKLAKNAINILCR